MSAPEVQINAEVTRQIRQHARASMTTEVCGILIGDLLPGTETDTEIFAAIAAVNATQAGTHVTFTQDAWEHIYKVKDAQYPTARIVGWYHSHPGFGVFLSEHDTFIQQNFFSAPNQVAWVFDPHTDEEGCFGWIDGTIARLTAITITDVSTNVSETRELAPLEQIEERRDDPEPESVTKRKVRTGPPPRWLRWTASISALLATLLLGFTIARILFPSLYPLVLPMNPVTGEPMLRDPKTGESVYMDPQTGKYLIMDRRTGKLTTVAPEPFKHALPSADNPFPVQPAPPLQNPPFQAPSKEKK